MSKNLSKLKALKEEDLGQFWAIKRQITNLESETTSQSENQNNLLDDIISNLKAFVQDEVNEPLVENTHKYVEQVAMIKPAMAEMATKLQADVQTLQTEVAGMKSMLADVLAELRSQHD